MAHSIGSIRDMLRKYREELSLQPTRDCNAGASLDEEVASDRNGSFQSAKMFTENISHEVGRSHSSAKSRKLRWLPTSPSGNGHTSMLEAGSCQPLTPWVKDKVEVTDIQHLDYRATEVLQRSRQAVEAGKALSSSLALVTKDGLQVHCTKELKPGEYASHCLESVERVHHKNRKNHRSAMEDVVRKFEEIEKILEETKFNMKQSSITDGQHRPGPYSINIARETPPAWKQVGELTRESPQEEYGNTRRSSKQDEADREVAAIRAAMNFLNNGSGYSSNALSERLLGTTKNQRESKRFSPINGGVKTCAYISSEWKSSPYEVVRSQGMMSGSNKQANKTDVSTYITCKQPRQASKCVPFGGVDSFDAPYHGRQSMSATKHIKKEGLRKAQSSVESPILALGGTWKFTKQEEPIHERAHVDNMGSLILDSQKYSKSGWDISTKELHSTTKAKGMKRVFKNRSTDFVHNLITPNEDRARGDDASGDLNLGVGIRSWSETLIKKDSKTSVDERKRLLDLEMDMLKASRCQIDVQGQKHHEHQLSSQSPFAVSHFANPTSHHDVLNYARQGHKEENFQTYPAGSMFGSHCLSKTSNFQRNKIRHFGSLFTTTQRCPTGRLRGLKDKGSRSPTWVHRLNVRKPPKWRVVQPGYRTSAAVVEELEELACQHNWPRETTLEGPAPKIGLIMNGVTPDPSSCHRVCKNLAVSNSNGNWQAAREVLLSTTARNPATLQVLRKRTRNDALQIDQDAKASPSCHQQRADRFCKVKDDAASLPLVSSTQLESSVPRVLAVRDRPQGGNPSTSLASCGIASLAAPFSSTLFCPDLDSLISEVIQEWLEKDINPCTVCHGYRHGDESLHSGSTSKLRTEVTDGDCANSLSSQPNSQDELHNKTREMREQGKDDNVELVKVPGKNSVAAFASLVPSLIAALQEAEKEEDIVREFEADETVCLLLEKLQFYETRLRGMKRRALGCIKEPLAVFVETFSESIEYNLPR